MKMGLTTISKGLVGRDGPFDRQKVGDGPSGRDDPRGRRESEPADFVPQIANPRHLAF